MIADGGVEVVVKGECQHFLFSKLLEQEVCYLYFGLTHRLLQLISSLIVDETTLADGVLRKLLRLSLNWL